MNLPNKITLSRIFIVPVFMLFVVPLPAWLGGSDWLRVIHGNYIAAAIFIIASSTDVVDGYIARKRKLVTRFGKFLDPIADKLLVTAAILALVQTGDISGWVAMIIIAREFIVTGLRLVAAGEGIVIAASKLGKFKTILQDIAIVAIILHNFPLSTFTSFPFDTYAMTAAVLITVYSLYDYIKKNIKVINYNS